MVRDAHGQDLYDDDIVLLVNNAQNDDGIEVQAGTWGRVSRKDDWDNVIVEGPHIPKYVSVKGYDLNKIDVIPAVHGRYSTG